MANPEIRVQFVWAHPSTLELMKNRDAVPKYDDRTELPGGTKLGIFWKDCKSPRRCERPPYGRLLINPVLKADYRAIISGTRGRRPDLGGRPWNPRSRFRPYGGSRPL